MKLLFLRHTGLGSIVAEKDQVLEVEDEGLVWDLINTGRATTAPGEDPVVAPTALTSASINSKTKKATNA